MRCKVRNPNCGLLLCLVDGVVWIERSVVLSSFGYHELCHSSCWVLLFAALNLVMIARPQEVGNAVPRVLKWPQASATSLHQPKKATQQFPTSLPTKVTSIRHLITSCIPHETTKWPATPSVGIRSPGWQGCNRGQAPATHEVAACALGGSYSSGHRHSRAGACHQY